ncbi:MAG: prephenate dehydratase [Terriglobales bacterium]|jgi:prephenate dehydratase
MFPSRRGKPGLYKWKFAVRRGNGFMKIAIQGELGSFSHEAAEAMLPQAKVVPCARSLDVFDRVKRGTVDGAVIPIENSLAGSVAEHFDLLLGRDVHIVREFRLRIVHNLIALPGTKLGDVRRVFSHPVALDQCRDLFTKNPRLEPVPFYDTAGSVKHVVAEGLRDAAGIASRRAVAVYGGKILKAGIEDDKKNFTRFFLIERGKIKRGKPRAARNGDKTSLAFSVKNIPGALFKALSVFALRDISLSKIESRPMRGRPWEYVFFVDLLCGDDEDSRNALRHLSEVAELVKVLGIYPEA